MKLTENKTPILSLIKKLYLLRSIHNVNTAVAFFLLQLQRGIPLIKQLFPISCIGDNWRWQNYHLHTKLVSAVHKQEPAFNFHVN